MIQIGRQFGHFQIQAEIGKGGMGTIYHAVDMMLNREVALKVIHPQYADNAQLMERFKIEAMTQARMNHPNIVMIFSFTKIENEFVIAMEYIAGKSMKELLREKQCFTVSPAVSFLQQILDGLKYSHSLNVIHRDIKPANMLITGSDRIKISDFGIAKVFGTEGMTKTGILVGTPWYTSPEQILGKNIDYRADLYSLGVTFFEMVTGRVPFDSSNNSEFQVQRAHLEMQPPRPSQYNPAVPAEVERFILKALQKKPEKRFQTAGEMLQASQDLISSRPLSIPESITGAALRETPTTLIRQQRRSFTPVKVVGFSIILLTLALTGGYFMGLFKPFQATKSEPQPATALVEPMTDSSQTQENKPADNQPKDLSLGKIGTPQEGRSDDLFNRGENAPNTSQTNANASIPGGSQLNAERESVSTKPPDQAKVEPKLPDEKPSADAKTTLTRSTDKVATDTKGKVIEKPVGQLQIQTIASKFDLPIEIRNLNSLVNRNEVQKALDRVEQIYRQEKDPMLYPWIGYLNFLTGQFDRAEEFFAKTLNNNIPLVIQVSHLHDDKTSCMGVLRLSKQVVMFESRNETLHNFRYLSTQISQVDRKKEGLMLEMGGEPARYFKILHGINATPAELERFLAEIINKFIHIK